MDTEKETSVESDEPPAEVVKAFKNQLDDYIDGFMDDMRAGMADEGDDEDTEN